MYKKLLDMDGNESTKVIRRTADNAIIPMSEGNRDYQEYLEWLAEGNTPEDAD